MSVQTEADHRLAACRKDIDSAIENLSAIVVHQCSGHDSWNSTFSTRMRLELAKLLEIREQLK